MPNFSIKDENSDHKFFSILQNILSNIDLTAFERSLYWAIKESSGERGSCTKSYAKLAKSSGMSLNSVKRTIKSLEKPNLVLGKPLIIVKDRLTEFGDRDTCEIVLVDLWNDNIKFFQKNIGQATQSPPPPSQAPGQATQSQGVRPHRADGQLSQSYNKDIKNPMNKISSPLKVPKSGKVEGVIKKEIFLLIEDAKKCNFPFSEASIFQSYKETSGPAVQTALKVYAKRKGKSQNLDYPDQWLKKEALKQFEYELCKKEAEGKI